MKSTNLIKWLKASTAALIIAAIIAVVGNFILTKSDKTGPDQAKARQGMSALIPALNINSVDSIRFIQEDPTRADSTLESILKVVPNLGTTSEEININLAGLSEQVLWCQNFDLDSRYKPGEYLLPCYPFFSYKLENKFGMVSWDFYRMLSPANPASQSFMMAVVPNYNYINFGGTADDRLIFFLRVREP